MTPGCDSREDNNLSSDAEVPTLPAKTLPLSRSRSVKRDIVGTHQIFVFYSLGDVRDGFARDCPLRHPVPSVLALRVRSGATPSFSMDFRRFQRSRARRRGGESRLGRGGGRCPRDRLPSQVRWSGVLREPCTTDPCQSSGPRSVGFRDGSPASPGICASRTSRGAAAEPTSQKLTMTRGARGPAPAGATWRPGAGLGVSRCAHRASDTGMDPGHRPQAGARDPRRAARPTVHRPGHRRRMPRRRAQRAR